MFSGADIAECWLDLRHQAARIRKLKGGKGVFVFEISYPT